MQPATGVHVIEVRRGVGCGGEEGTVRARVSSISENTSSFGRPTRLSTAPPSSNADSCGPVSRAVAPEAASLRRCFSSFARTNIGIESTVG